MLDFVLIGRGEMGAHAAVVAGDNHTALSSGLNIIHAVFSVHTRQPAGLLKSFGVLVFANAANVEDRIVGEDVLVASQHSHIIQSRQLGTNLGTTSRVLSSTPSDQLRVTAQ